MKILITGGHPSPALAVIKSLKQNKEADIHFVGKKYAREGEEALSYEYKEITKIKIPFYKLETGRLTRIVSIESLLSFLKIFNGLYESFFLIKELRPDVVMSFGGYIALPVCYVAKAFKIKIITHEQTISPGLANKLIGRIADKILISFPETIKYFDVHRTKVVGNPIRENALHTIDKPFDIKNKRPLIYITGGNLGSHSINVHIEKILPQLLKKYSIVHQIGNVEQYGDFKRLSKIKKKHYKAISHLSSDEVGSVYRTADLVITRAGANSTFEMIALRKPCILIPLPWSANNEQELHAKLIANAKAGEIFDQEGESSELLDLINKMMSDLTPYKNSFKSLQIYIHRNSADEIVKEILE